MIVTRMQSIDKKWKGEKKTNYIMLCGLDTLFKCQRYSSSCGICRALEIRIGKKEVHKTYS